jgi:hypothetical protein
VESSINSRKESNKSSRASSEGNQGFGVRRKVAVGISVEGGRIIRVGVIKEAVVEGGHTG